MNAAIRQFKHYEFLQCTLMRYRKKAMNTAGSDCG